MQSFTNHQTAARAVRLAEIRLRIEAGTYETPDRLERAVETFLQRQSGNPAATENAGRRECTIAFRIEPTA